MAKKKKPNNAAPTKSKPAKKTKQPASGKKNTGKKKRPKIIGDLHSSSPEAKAIYKQRTYYKNHAKALAQQKVYDARQAEKKNQEFLKYYNKTYPIGDE